MQKAICDLSCVPLRAEPFDKSEMINQLLFGETMQLMDANDKWYMVQLDHDGYEGWLDKKQVTLYDGEGKNFTIATSPFFEIKNETGLVSVLSAGSLLHTCAENKFSCGEKKFELLNSKAIENKSISIATAAHMFCNVPYLWGGRTVFGMDCSGFTQIAFRLAGKWIPRDASQQALQGELVNFLEESKSGDLAFFDNADGKITHVGVVLKDEIPEQTSIIHCSGRVKIERLDTYGIFNQESANYSHNLRFIKRVA